MVYEIGPSTVMLSRSEVSVVLGVEMLRCAQHDSMVMPAATRECHPEPQRRVCRSVRRPSRSPGSNGTNGACLQPKNMYTTKQLLCLKIPIKMSAMWALFNE